MWLNGSKVSLVHCKKSCDMSRNRCKSRNVERLFANDYIEDRDKFDLLGLPYLYKTLFLNGKLTR